MPASFYNLGNNTEHTEVIVQSLTDVGYFITYLRNGFGVIVHHPDNLCPRIFELIPHIPTEYLKYIQDIRTNYDYAVPNRHIIWENKDRINEI